MRFLHSSLHILCFDICIDWQEKTNDKTQLSASFPWGVQNQKKTKKNKKQKQRNKKKRKKENQEDLLGQSACDIGLFFCFVLFFFGFGNL